MVQVLQSPVQHKVACPTCGALLGYTELEIKSRTYKDISQCTEIDHYIECPCCYNDVMVTKHRSSMIGYYREHSY